MLFDFLLLGNALGTYEGVASVALAMEHLNTGNGSIVREIEGINKKCPLRFITEVFDYGGQASRGMDIAINLTDRVGRESDGRLLPCAILGADRSSVSVPTSIISGLRGFPQFSPISTSSELDDKSQYKLFGRTIPNDDGTSVPLVSKLVSWNVRYFAVLHVDDSYGNAFARGIRSAVLGEPSILRVETIPLKESANNESIAEAIKQLKDTEFKYFFGVFFLTDADNIMSEAYNQGIAGTGEHTWIFSDGLGGHVTGRNFKIGSPLEKSYRGTSIMQATGGIPGVGVDGFDELTKSLYVLGANEADRAYLDGLYPMSSSDEIFVNIPGIVGPFLYDAVIAIGLASCEMLESNTSGSYNITGESLYESILDTSFNGTSGSVVFDPITGTRDPFSALFSLTNFVNDEDAVVGSGLTQFKGRETDLFKLGDWVSLSPFIFNDGTVNIPPDLPRIDTNENYLSAGVKAMSLFLCGLIIILAFASSYWTFHNSKKSIVRSSQPLFLHIISVGTLLMGECFDVYCIIVLIGTIRS
jgi:hypothetical protein